MCFNWVRNKILDSIIESQEASSFFIIDQFPKSMAFMVHKVEKENDKKLKHQ